MSNKVCFIGHRRIGQKISDKLFNAIQNEIDSGCRVFTMSTYGTFDEMALNACRSFRRKYKDIKIEVVITSFNKIKKEEYYTPYSDTDTIMYSIEEVYYKQKIIASNQQMIDSCDTMICYVDPKQKISGAKLAKDYATKQGLRIINLYKD